MSLPAAEGPITAPERALALTLANTTRWQSVVGPGVGSPTAAAGKIFFHGLPPAADGEAFAVGEAAAYRPFAMIFTHPFNGWRAKRSAANTFWRTSGKLLICFEFPVPADVGGNDAWLMAQVTNDLGRIAFADPAAANTYGLVNLAHTAPDDDHLYLAIDDIELQALYRCEDDDEEPQGDHVVAELLITWGA